MNWYNKFELLKQFKEKNGHCNVPTKDEELGGWVKRQQQYFKQLSPNQSNLNETIMLSFKVFLLSLIRPNIML